MDSVLPIRLDCVEDSYSLDKEIERNLGKDQYDGKTYRRKGSSRLYLWSYKKNNVITISRDTKIETGYLEMPITAVEESVETFMTASISGRSDIHSNKASLWDDTEAEIKAHAISMVSHVGRYREVMEIYSVPVTKHVIIDTTDSYKIPQDGSHDWFECNGKTYDPKYLYVANQYSSTFTPLCLIYPELPNLGENIFPLKAQINEYIHGRAINRAFNGKICEYLSYYGNTRNHEGTEINSILIKFTSPQLITHIGTFGEYIEYTSWNSKLNFSKYRDGRNRRKLSKSKGRIFVVSQTEYAFTTSFKIEYRDIVSNKWINIGIFRGNHNAFDINVVDLSGHFNKEHGLHTRSLKITPVEYNLRPSMRIQIFGKSTDILKSEQDVVKYTITRFPIGDWDYTDYRYDAYNECTHTCKHWGKIRKGKAKQLFDKYTKDCIDTIDLFDE